MNILLDIKRMELDGKKGIGSRMKWILLSLYIQIANPVHRYIVYPIKRFIRGIKNICLWMPLIYSDIQWDYSALYEMLYKKFTLMEKFFRSPKAMTMDSEKRADEIHECIEILERLMKDDYAKDKYEAYHAKWGRADFIFTELKDEPGYSELHIVYPNVKTEEDEKERSEEFTNITKAEVAEHEQDVHALFSKLQQRVEFWWD